MKKYLDMLQHILDKGVKKGDRTGTGTISVFGYQERFNMMDGFPLLTTKKMHLKSILRELLWFIRGDTNISYLNEHGVSIWDEWADENGDLGPVYGAQWRAWDGIDQLAGVIEQIKKTPDCRRQIVCSWNVSELHMMALHPCHILFQFWSRELSMVERVRWAHDHGHTAEMPHSSAEFDAMSEWLTSRDVPERALSMQMYQRSCDTFLGVPFNIASFAILLHMVAQCVNMVPEDFIHTYGDLHIYLNHLEQVKLQLSRKPHSLPELWLNPDVKNIDDFLFEDIEVRGYTSDKTIKAPISV